MTASKDFYDVLGLPKKATPEQIKQAYRKLMRENHPDRYTGTRKKYEQSGDPDLLKIIDEKITRANEATQEINEAYAILSDPDKRRDYDRTSGSTSRGSPSTSPTRSKPEIVLSTTNLNFGSITKGGKKTLSFTIDNHGGMPEEIHIDWEAVPTWTGELVIETHPTHTFPIKVTVEAITTKVASGSYTGRIVVIVDSVEYGVSVSLRVSAPGAAPTPMRPPKPIPATVFTALFRRTAKYWLGLIVIGVGILVASNFGVTLHTVTQEQTATTTATLIPTETPTPTPAPLFPFYLSVVDYNGSKSMIKIVDGSGNIMNGSGWSFDVPFTDALWSPDLSKILTVNDDGAVVWNRDTLKMEYSIPDAQNPIWSPDGKSIAFSLIERCRGYRLYSEDPYKSSFVWIANADGSNMRNITPQGCEPDGGYYSPAWSPDGTIIAFIYNNGDTDPGFIDRINFITLHYINFGDWIRGYFWRPAWSPDGQYLSYGKADKFGLERQLLCIADSNLDTNLGTNEQCRDLLVVNANDVTVGPTSSWSPDGKWIAVDFCRSKGSGDLGYGVCVLPVENFETAEPIFVTEGRSPQWLSAIP